MKLSITASLCAGAFACSHASPPAKAPASSALPNRVELAQTAPPPAAVSALPAPQATTPAPQAAATVTAATPTPPFVAVPPDEPLTPASSSGGPRTASAQLVPAGPAQAGLAQDRAESAEDQASIREIRSSLGSDSSLASVAPHVVVVARNGRVWLRGQVNTAEQRAAVEKVAREAVGVIDVRNELVVLE